MPASVRVIKIVKDKNPMSGEEEDDYTVEFECIADNAKDLAKELAACPLGERTMELIERAKFMPEHKEGNVEEMKKQAEEEERERVKHDEELREEGRTETREKDVAYLREKKKEKAADLLQKLTEKEKEEKTENNKSVENPENASPT